MSDTRAPSAPSSWLRAPKRAEPASTRTVMQAVYQRLLHEILTLELKPGEALSENMLADRLNVSRTPVREALVLLATKQLVDIYPQRKTIVAPIRISNLKKSQFIRESLEINLIKKALESGHQLALHEELERQIAFQETCIRNGDIASFYASDEAFHRSIVDHAGLPELWMDIADAKLHMDRARQFTLKHVDSMAEIIEQHRAIALAIKSGESAIAETAVKEHLRKIFQHLSQTATQFPEYFEFDA
ncbi:GntR family transcriptional regulator [Castellaniella defragrans]|uniref:DNA-binding GntR family transcriptional regulator n=1 Tax=Castellaniella defragrans TaxID=75697 RepID=A0A7W9TMH6_CASDE|nr:GntR family transcriptional regulator [Castellaniella defragrans]MBB6083455.1 DNA-binding GntR family transcriptional regulator [Castellaniella defragrans]